MVPAMMEQLLFDDILLGDAARDEHSRFRRVLQLAGVEVLDAQDLLVEALESSEAREWLSDWTLGDLSDRERGTIEALPVAQFAAALVEGVRREAPRADSPEELFSILPLPNWCFQRDPQILVGDGVIVSEMAAPARRREAALSRAILRHHPRFREAKILHDPVAHGAWFAGEEPSMLEGGDVLVISPDIIAVGLSERTNRIGLRRLARAVSRLEPRPRWMVAVEVPRRRAYMHLDTLITVVDRDAALVHSPVILGTGSERSEVFELDLHASEPEFRPAGTLLDWLATHGQGFEPIPCGGSDPVAQQREQWTDGANALALAPGVITLFDRNQATIEELDRRGFRIVGAEDLLLGREELELDDPGRVCILVPSHEISRARGGPHCLVHPVERDSC